MKEFFHLEANEKEKIKQRLKKELQQKEEIIFAYLHGSFIDLIANFRDIDLAIWTKPEAALPESTFALDMSLALEKQLRFPVDVQVLNFASIGFKFSVFKYGELLFSKDNELLTNLIEQVANEYMAFYELALAEFK